MAKIVEFGQPNDNSVEKLLNLCADTNKCLDFKDSLGNMVMDSSDELSFEELENVAGGLNAQSIVVPPLDPQ